MQNKFQLLGVDKVKEIISNSHSLSDILINCGYCVASGNLLSIFKRFCKENNIDYSHFLIKSQKNIERNEGNVFCLNSTADQKTLRKFFYRRKDVDLRHCSVCGCDDEWNGKRLVLILDHINGQNHDNRIENLRLVCPNCNSQLPTFAGRNISYRKENKQCNCEKIL